MSTFGTAVAVDVAPDGDLEPLQRAFGSDNPVVSCDLETGWTRTTTHLGEIEQLDRIKSVLGAVGHGRAAIAEDCDEYGALWVVLSASGGRVRTVHRRYVLNADPNDPRAVAAALQDFAGADPRAADVAGASAATEAAELFEVDATAMVHAEASADVAHEGIGIVGGPFPWWEALGLEW